MLSHIALFLVTTQVEQNLLTDMKASSQHFQWHLVVSGPESNLTLTKNVAHLQGLPVPKEISCPFSRALVSHVTKTGTAFQGSCEKFWDTFDQILGPYQPFFLYKRGIQYKNCSYIFPWRSWQYSKDTMIWLISDTICPKWPLYEKSVLGTLDGTQRK